MLALLENAWFYVIASFVIFALPALVGGALVVKDTRQAIRQGRITTGSRSGRDTTYERDLDPKLFWGAVVFKSIWWLVFLCFPALIFVRLSWSHLRAILAGWHGI